MASEDPEVQCPENEQFPCPAIITDQEISEVCHCDIPFFFNLFPVGNIVEKAVCKSVFLTI